MGDIFKINSYICNLYTVEYDIQKAQNSFSQLKPNFSRMCHFHDSQRHTWIRSRLLKVAFQEVHKTKRAEDVE